jgi:uncharacterized protein (DUF58 family)
MQFGNPSKLRFAQQLAAALGYIGLCRSDRIKIEPLSERPLPATTALRGKSNLWKLLQQIESLPNAPETALEPAIKKFCIRNPSKGIVVLLSDLLDKNGYENALRALIARQYDVYVIQILSPEELDPELVGDLKLVDCEDGEFSEVSVSPRLLQQYRTTLQNFLSQIRQFCSRRGIVHLTCSTQQSVDQLVGTYLRSRGLVR